MKQKPPTEKHIQLGILSALGYKGWTCFRMPPSIYSGQKGVPDIYAIKDGIGVWLEIKSAKGKLSLQQEQWGNRLTDAGGLYIVCRTVDFALKCLESIEIDMNGVTVKPCKGMRLMVREAGNVKF